MSEIIDLLFFQVTPMIIIIQIIAVIVDVISARTENPKVVYFLTFAFNALNLALYVIRGDLTASINMVGTTVRAFLYMHRDRLHSNIWPWLFISFHIIFGFLTISNPMQVITIIAPCSVCFFMWYFYKDIQKLRISHIINASCWLSYNIYSQMYIIAIQRVITIIANIWNYHKHNKNLKQE